jgi:hypothetical protein
MSKQHLRVGFLLLALGALPAWAAEPSGGGSGPGSDPTPFNPPPIERDRNTGNTNFSDQGQVTGLIVQGRVTDSAGQAVEGVKVKLFSAGLLVSTSVTDGEGKFKISGSPDFTEDRSADLWFGSPDPRWVDSSILLRTGSTLSYDALRPACTPVIPLLGGSATVEIKMLTFEERRDEISRLKCLASAAKH